MIDKSKTVVTIYSDKEKKKIITPKAGVYNVKTPTFFIVDDQTAVGYYAYFGVNKKADPAKVGKFISDTSFTPTVIKKNGSYYFIDDSKRAPFSSAH